MSFANTYKSKGYRIGHLNRKITFYTPVSEKSELGGEILTYASWLSTWTAVEAVPSGSNEQEESNRLTAFNVLKFIVRYRSSIHEKMLITYDGKQMDIQRIHEKIDTPTKHYLVIIAKYKDTDEVLDGVGGGNTGSNVNLSNFLKLDFSQIHEGFSGNVWTINNGTVLSPEVVGDSEYYQRIAVYRSGVRLLKNIHYSVSGQNITFVHKVRNEPLIYQQYQKVT